MKHKDRSIHGRLAPRQTGSMTAGGGSAFMLIGCSTASTKDQYPGF